MTEELKQAANTIHVHVVGPVGCGKSAMAGEIEILCKALGLDVSWPDGQSEKNMVGADWQHALDMYRPSVVIHEALTQRPAAQTEHLLYEDGSPGPASLTAPQQATPAQEPHPLAAHCYTMSESHLSGYRLILGFETMEAVNAAQTWVANINKGTQQATPEPVAFSHAGHFYNLVSHALMDVKRPDACGYRLRLILDELATLMAQPATPEPVGEPVHVEVVGEIVSTDDGNDVSWSIEGGVAAIPEGSVLLIADSPITDGCGIGDVYTRPAAAPAVPEGFDVKALTATGGGHKYPLIVVREKSSQLGEDVFQDEHPVIYGLLSAWLAAAQAKGEKA